MAIKTFTTGEVLTASDTNTYLANSGLVFIKQQTIGTTVASVTVSSAFSSTYDNYLVTISGNSASATNNLLFQLSGATGSTYFTNLMYWAYGSAGLNGFGPAATTTATVCQAYVGEPYVIKLDLFNPNLAKRTYGFFNETGANNGGVGQFMETGVAQHTGFTLSTSSGTITGGTITVYGYRKE
jgi:hypothetical protein